MNKKLLICIILSCFIIAVFLHFGVLKFRNHYQLHFGGTGDKEYFNNNNFGPKFGIKNHSLSVRTKWVRPMGRRFFLMLPQHFKGDALILSFSISSLEKQPIPLVIVNNRKISIGHFIVPPKEEFQSYSIKLKPGQLPDGKLDILVKNSERKLNHTKLLLEKVDIYSAGGSVLPWKYNLLFLGLTGSLFIVCLIGGFSVLASSLGSLGMIIIFSFVRFIDVLAYIKYIQSIIPCIPFLIVAAVLIKFLVKKNRLFSEESRHVIFGILLLVFAIHFFGQFYIYHFHWDVQRRMDYCWILQNHGIEEYNKALYPSLLDYTGATQGIVPYPPWYNYLASPFIKLGFSIDFWLRFQYLVFASFFPLLIYALVRQLGFKKHEARWSGFTSIFFMGFLDDLFFNAYDRLVAFMFTTLFLIFWFKAFQDLKKVSFKKCISLGGLLGFAFILHPSILMILSMFLGILILSEFFRKKEYRWVFIRKTILIYSIGLILSLIIFYGPFIWEIITKTIPSALTSHNFKTHHSEGAILLIGKAFVQSVYRLLRYFPIVLMPLLITGFLSCRKKLRLEKKLSLINSLNIWIITYILLVLLRSKYLLGNFFRNVAEQHFIYPLAAVFLGIAIVHILNIKINNDSSFTLKIAKTSLFFILGLWSVFNLFWYYAVRIGMIQSLGNLPKWIKMIV